MEFENLLTLIKTVSDSHLTGFKYEENGVKIKLSKQSGQVQVVAGTVSDIPVQEMAEAEKVSQDQMKGQIIKSPLVGTFYAATS